MTTASQTAAEITANDLTFGVEFETVIPCGVIPVGGYHRGCPVTMLPGWKVESDSSIQVPHGHEDAEFVSPVLKGAEGLREVIKAVEYIKGIGGKVNFSCGFHVHVGWAGGEKALGRLVGDVSYYEKALYASSGTRTREEGHYCKTVRHGEKMARRFAERDATVEMKHQDRYSVLNITNLTHRPAVEFRVFSGTLNPTKAIGFISLALGLVQGALRAKRQPKWMPGDDATTRAAKGKAELRRLFTGIGWTKGNKPTAYGVIEAEGLPRLSEMKAELTRLSEKYDARCEAVLS